MSTGPGARLPVAAFRAPDGASLAYRVVEAAGPRAAVLMIHGWSDHLGRWNWPAERLREWGYSVYLLDLRGHGRSAGRRGHFARFAQLLADVHAFRREVMAPATIPHVLFGHSFGGLLVLRYLETDPDLPVGAGIVSSPFLGLAFEPPRWKRILARLLADAASGLHIPAGIDAAALSRDPAVGPAYREDPLVHDRMTPGAWREIERAQALTSAHGDRITVPVLVLVGGADRIVDAQRAVAFARALPQAVLREYPEMLHELLNDPDRDRVMRDIEEFLRGAL